eukprot:6107783-Amphidinium_carterae.1
MPLCVGVCLVENSRPDKWPENCEVPTICLALIGRSPSHRTRSAVWLHIHIRPRFSAAAILSLLHSHPLCELMAARLAFDELLGGLGWEPKCQCEAQFCRHLNGVCSMLYAHSLPDGALLKCLACPSKSCEACLTWGPAPPR